MDEVRVSQSEFAKLTYLKGAIAAAEKMHARHKNDRKELLFHEGAELHRRVDWRRVVNECAPDVLVVMAHDGTRNHEVFDDFPMYALLPRTGVYLHLQDEVSLSIEEGLAVRREQVVSALNLLRLSTASIDESKRDNARKLLSGLHKLLLN